MAARSRTLPLGIVAVPRPLQRAAVLLSVAVLGLAVAMIAVGYGVNAERVPVGLDWIGYRQGVERFLATGTPYERFELIGPFTPVHLDFIHPPSAIPLFMPFTLLPTPFDYLAWMGIPVALTLALLVRTAWWSWPLIALLGITANTLITYINGNSSMWLAAAFGWSLYLGWPAGLLALKPSLALLALPGLWKRPRATVVLALAPILITLPFVGAWIDFVNVLGNARGLDWTYSIVQWPVFLIVAMPWLSDRGPSWLGRKRHRFAAASE